MPAQCMLTDCHTVRQQSTADTQKLQVREKIEIIFKMRMQNADKRSHSQQFIG